MLCKKKIDLNTQTRQSDLEYLLSITKEESEKNMSSKYYIDIPGDFPHGE